MKTTINVSRLGALLTLALSSPLMAMDDQLDVTFTATLRETTCDMQIVGGSGDGTNNTIPIGTSGKVQVNHIASGDDLASTNFKLKIIDCPASLSGLKTSINGAASSYVKTAIINAATSTKADYTGVTIARASAPTSPFTINSQDDSTRLVWTAAEINSKEVPLIARLVETQTGKATTGNFSAVATFNFVYE